MPWDGDLGHLEGDIACRATLVLPVLFNFAEAPAPEPIKYVVDIAVKTFLVAYRAR